MKKKEIKSGLKDTISELNKKFGKGSILPLKSEETLNLEYWPSNVAAIDDILNGGFPKNRIIEIFGNESVGKTSLALHMIGQVQKLGLACAYIDLEHAWDRQQAEKLGVNTGDLFFSQPGNGEEGLEILERLAESGELGLIVLDSVAGVVTTSELEGELTDANIGSTARLMGKTMRRLASILNKTDGKTSVIFINQNREKPGVMFGSPVYQTGGKALKFYASLRLELFRKEVIKDAELPIGITVRMKVAKSKTSTPFKECFYNLYFNEGIK